LTGNPEPPQGGGGVLDYMVWVELHKKSLNTEVKFISWKYCIIIVVLLMDIVAVWLIDVFFPLFLQDYDMHCHVGQTLSVTQNICSYVS
jgi:hypothetical protein